MPSDRFCALAEADLAGVSGACRWPMSSISVHANLAIGLDPTTIFNVFQRCFDEWNAVANLALHAATTPAGANIVSVSGPIDGPAGVLGLSYLPCGNVTPQTSLGQTYDNGEPWTADLLYRVVLHELGHALGLDHAPQGSGAVMEPYLGPYRSPQQWDIREIQSRYGPPRPPVAPEPPAEPSFPLSIPAAGNYLVYLATADKAVGGGVIMRFPAPGTYEFAVTATRR